MLLIIPQFYLTKARKYFEVFRWKSPIHIFYYDWSCAYPLKKNKKQTHLMDICISKRNWKI